jgi:DNA polymerase III subunit delta'
MDDYPNQWQRIQTALVNKRIPPAFLLIGPLHCAIAQFTTQIIQLFLCKINNTSPCLSCADCLMVQRKEHPDVHWIKPEKSGASIKVDQIRGLHSSVFLTSQRSIYKLIIIECADRMNVAASNALLKMLEEPSQHTHFILIAEQISTVLPTILSRCQKLHFSSSHDNFLDNLLLLGTFYPADSERSLLMKQSEAFIEELIALIEMKQHPCLLATKWNQFELSNVLWFLYLIYSQVSYGYINTLSARTLALDQLNKLKSLLTPVLIFSQIDKINNIQRKLSHNININQLLSLEDLLFSLTEHAK